jgi:hypothetical protein
MSDISLHCPHCQQSLAAPSDMEGMFIDCPACGKQLAIPKGTTKGGAIPLAMRDGHYILKEKSMEASNEMKKSKNILIFMFVIFLFTDCVISIFSKDNLIRPALTAGLFYLVLSGKVWAYWTTIVLFSLATFFCIAASIFFLSQHHTEGSLVMIVIMPLMLSILCFLLFSKNLKGYLAFKRNASSNISLRGRRP